MRYFHLIICTLLWFSTTINGSHAHAYTLKSNTVRNDHSSSQLISDRHSFKAGEPFWVNMRIDMDDHWHTYWKNPGDSGYATDVTLTLPEGFIASDIQWLPPIRFEMAGIVNYGYKDVANHFIRITPPAHWTEDITIHATASWLICEDICVPESGSYHINIPHHHIPASSNIDFHQDIANIPSLDDGTYHYHQTDTHIHIPLPSSFDAEHTAFFPIDNNIISNETLPIIQRNNGQSWLMFNKGEFADEQPLRAILLNTIIQHAKELHFHHDASLTPTTIQQQQNITDLGTLPALLLAFLGGVLLNLMPCVLPILSLKAFTLVKHRDNASPAAHGIAYTLGVVISFIAIAVILILLQQGGQEIGWGFQLQAPIVVTTMSLLMLTVGLNLSGVFEIPTIFSNIGQRKTNASATSSSFFTGMLAVLVATPCTAPFMAPALGFAITQPPITALLVFMALGIGMAAPFLIISIIPSAVALLPKPGAWMLTFKQFLAFPMYGTAAWLAWVLARQEGAEGIAILFAMAVILSLLLWMIGKTHCKHRKTMILITIGAVLWLGFNSIQRLGMVSEMTHYKQPYSASLLAEYRTTNTPIFVYGTADWCITCKVNERIALNTETVLEHFKTHNIAVLEADWTDYDDNITSFLKEHGRAGVPLYVYYEGDAPAVIMPQLLTPSIIIDQTTTTP